MHHYTDKPSWNAIRSQVDWTFSASQPPGEHPFGAYFTTLHPTTPNLAARLRIPKAKTEYVFCFIDVGDLTPLPGGRGTFIFYFPGDYVVAQPRQLSSGEVAAGACA